MKTLRKNGGFTLVELIVVIAILAILAGVAVPAYTGYINKAKDAADITQLDAIKTAAQATYATEGAVTKIVVTAANGEVTTIKVNDTHTLNWDSNNWKEAVIKDKSTENISTDFDTFMNSKNPKLTGSYANGAKWENGTWSVNK